MIRSKLDKKTKDMTRDYINGTIKSKQGVSMAQGFITSLRPNLRNFVVSQLFETVFLESYLGQISKMDFHTKEKTTKYRELMKASYPLDVFDNSYENNDSQNFN